MQSRVRQGTNRMLTVVVVQTILDKLTILGAAQQFPSSIEENDIEVHRRNRKQDLDGGGWNKGLPIYSNQE